MTHLPTSAAIPAQWLPAFIRWPVRAVLLPFVWLDVAAQRVMRLVLRPPWKLEGTCTRRGDCCRYIVASLPTPTMRWRWLEWSAELWMTQVHGFYRRGFDAELQAGETAMVFGCRYLQDDGQCAHYQWRPMLCREYPRRAYTRPRLLRGCGYRVVDDKPSRLTILQ